MKIATGTVVHGKIVVEGQPFVEGEQVTILGQDHGETFQVSPEEKRLLLQSIAQANRGEFVDADELLTEAGLSFCEHEVDREAIIEQIGHAQHLLEATPRLRAAVVQDAHRCVHGRRPELGVVGHPASIPPRERP